MADPNTSEPTPIAAEAAQALGTTHVLLAVDRSGSMYDLAEDVRGGFNSFLDDLAGDVRADRFRVTVVTFSTEWAPLCVDAALANVPRLDRDNYRAGGGTALYDAVGSLISDFERVTTLGEHDRVMLVVQTDGKENSSREYVATTIHQMITAREAGGKWTTAYLGAGPQAWGGGAAMGMRSVDTTADPHGTRSSYAGIATAASAYAGGASRSRTFDVLSGTAQGRGQAE